MNQVSFVGRIVRDIQVNETQDGNKVLNNVIAVQRRFKNSQQAEADFVPFVAWGNRCQIIEKYCKKGDLIGLNGRLQSRSYEKEERKVYVVELIVEQIHLLQQNRKEEPAPSSSKIIEAKDIASLN